MTRAPEELEPVRRRSLADDIADRIRSRILDGTYSPGEKLPPERELARQLKVNRGSLREALKKLQHLGLIRIRQGDGTRVQDFLSTANVDIIKYLFQERAMDRRKLLTDLMEVRTHTCSLIVELACRRAEREALEELRESVRDMHAHHHEMDAARALQLDFEFYERLAQLSGNVILSLMMNSVKPPFWTFKPALVKLVPAPAEMLETHEQVLDAMIGGDAERAAEAARGWLERGAERFLAYRTLDDDEPAAD